MNITILIAHIFALLFTSSVFASSDKQLNNLKEIFEKESTKLHKKIKQSRHTRDHNFAKINKKFDHKIVQLNNEKDIKLDKQSIVKDIREHFKSLARKSADGRITTNEMDKELKKVLSTIKQQQPVINSFFNNKSTPVYSAIKMEYEEELNYYKQIQAHLNSIELSYFNNPNLNKDNKLVKYKCEVYKNLNGMIIDRSSWKNVFSADLKLKKKQVELISDIQKTEWLSNKYKEILKRIKPLIKATKGKDVAVIIDNFKKDIEKKKTNINNKIKQKYSLLKKLDKEEDKLYQLTKNVTKHRISNLKCDDTTKFVKFRLETYPIK